MSKLRPLVATVLLLPLLLGAAPLEGQSATSVVYLVRHAEKADDGEDPPLTAAGRARAEALARMLGDAGLTAVLSTDYARTRETAAPVAAAYGLRVELYDPRDPEALRRRLGVPGRYLVVGHSNTVPSIVRDLGGDPGAPIEDDEYDRLYVMVGSDGSEALRAPERNVWLLLRFGEAYER